MSVNRLRKFLQGEELDPDGTDRNNEPVVGILTVVKECCLYHVIMFLVLGGEGAVDIKEGSFTWDTPEKPILSK